MRAWVHGESLTGRTSSTPCRGAFFGAGSYLPVEADADVYLDLSVNYFGERARPLVVSRTCTRFSFPTPGASRGTGGRSGSTVSGWDSATRKRSSACPTRRSSGVHRAYWVERWAQDVTS